LLRFLRGGVAFAGGFLRRNLLSTIEIINRRKYPFLWFLEVWFWGDEIFF
jgi:hypothetical protein